MNKDKLKMPIKYLIAILKAFIWLGISEIIEKAATMQAIQYSVSYNKEFQKIGDNIVEYSEAVLNTESAITYTILASLYIFIIMYFMDSRVVNPNSIRVKLIGIIDIVKFIPIGIIMNIFGALVLALIPHSIIESAGYSVNLNIYTSLLAMIICVGIATPICEELIFRYFIYNSVLKDTTTTFAIFLSSLTFALAHGNIIQSAYTFIYGVVFAYLNTKYKSILPGIILHIVINSLSVILLTENILGNNDTKELRIIAVLLIVSTLVTFMLSFMGKRRQKSVQL